MTPLMVMRDHLPSTVASAFLFEMTNEKCQMIDGKSLRGARPTHQLLRREPNDSFIAGLAASFDAYLGLTETLEPVG
jgi:hypothetical protein